MELIEFKKYDKVIDVLPMMSVFTSGFIKFNKVAVKNMGLKTGSKISFFRDERNPSDWYIKVTDNGVPLEYESTNILKLRFQNVVFEILKSFNISQNVRLTISEHPNEDGYYAIITRSGIENKK